jgi:hypothetical protein
MRYMCLMHFDPAILDNMPPAERQAFERRVAASDDALRASGQLVHAEAVQGGHSATLVRVRNGRSAVTDGPYMETKEQMGGFILIEARDLNEAIALAERDPMAEIGTVEVRPIYVIPPLPPLE